MEITKKFVYPLGEKEVSEKVDELMAKTGLSKLEAAILVNRNVKLEEVDELINSSVDDLIDPRLMKDAVKAADVIVDAIKNHKKICLYSDYDCDGWGAAIVGYKMIKEMGGDVEIFINKRSMGYGISAEGVDMVMKKWPDTKVILTADNGIVAFDAIEYANNIGLDVVVTDHHQPDAMGRIPNALAVVNPHRADDTYPYENLCGSGVLWKVLSICYYKMGIPAKRANTYLDIVAIATIADVVELRGENRIIVYHGLKMVSNDCRIQWKIFKDVFSDYNKIDTVDTRIVGFSFGPAINAISRMTGEITPAVEAFMIDDETKIRAIVNNLKVVNKERKILTEDFTNAAMMEAELQADLPICIINNEEFFDGVVGLVAGRVREIINKPTLVFTKENGVWKGSGRSIPGYHIKDALDVVQQETGLMVAYGGHSQACGVSVTDENMIDFRMAMLESADKIPMDAFIKNVIIDYDADISEIDNHFYDRIKNLEPFGNSFEEPMIGIRNFVPKEVKFIGSENQHLVLKGETFDVISWYGAKVVENGIPSSFTVCGRLERDNFGIKLYVEPENIQ
jgi:single-stranded-DNA-specific exonuclease